MAVSLVNFLYMDITATAEKLPDASFPNIQSHLIPSIDKRIPGPLHHMVKALDMRLYSRLYDGIGRRIFKGSVPPE